MKLNSTPLITLWNHVFGTDSEPDTAQLNDNFTSIQGQLALLGVVNPPSVPTQGIVLGGNGATDLTPSAPTATVGGYSLVSSKGAPLATFASASPTVTLPAVAGVYLVSLAFDAELTTVPANGERCTAGISCSNGLAVSQDALASVSQHTVGGGLNSLWSPGLGACCLLVPAAGGETLTVECGYSQYVAASPTASVARVVLAITRLN